MAVTYLVHGGYGKDTNLGTASLNGAGDAGPVKTVERAVELARINAPYTSGDKIQIKGGYTYTVNNTDDAMDLTGMDIIISAWTDDIPGGEPILQQGQSDVNIFEIVNIGGSSKAVTIKNITFVIKRGSSHCIFFYPTSYSNTDTYKVQACNFYGDWDRFSDEVFPHRAGVKQYFPGSEQGSSYAGPLIEIDDCSFSNIPIAVYIEAANKDRAKINRCLFYSCGSSGGKNAEAVVVANPPNNDLALTGIFLQVSKCLYLACKTWDTYRAWSLEPTAIKIDCKKSLVNDIGDDLDISLSFPGWNTGTGWTHDPDGLELIENAPSRDFSGSPHYWGNGTQNAGFGTGENDGSIDFTDDLSLDSGSYDNTQHVEIAPDHVPTIVGKNYTLKFDTSGLSGYPNTDTWSIKSLGIPSPNRITYGTVSTNGSQSLSFTATTNGGIKIENNNINCTGHFDNFSLIQTGTGEAEANWENSIDIANFWYDVSDLGMIPGKMYTIALSLFGLGYGRSGIGVDAGRYPAGSYPNGFTGDGDYQGSINGYTDAISSANNAKIGMFMMPMSAGAPTLSGGTAIHSFSNLTYRRDYGGPEFTNELASQLRYISDYYHRFIFQKVDGEDALVFKVTSLNGDQSNNPQCHSTWSQTYYTSEDPPVAYTLGPKRERFKFRMDKLILNQVSVVRVPFRDILTLDFRPPLQDDRPVAEEMDYGCYGSGSLYILDGEVIEVTMTDSYIIPHEIRRKGSAYVEWDNTNIWENISAQVDLPVGRPWTRYLEAARYDQLFIKSNYEESFFVQWNLLEDPLGTSTFAESTDKTTSILLLYGGATEVQTTGLSAIGVPYGQIPGWYNLHGTDNYGGRTAKMTAGKHDITIEQGANFKRTFSWKDSAASPVTLVGYTVLMNIKAKKSDTSALYSDAGTHITLGGTAGTVDINIPAATTGALDFDWGYWDIELKKTSTGDITRLLEGKVNLSKQVTTVAP